MNTIQKLARTLAIISVASAASLANAQGRDSVSAVTNSSSTTNSAPTADSTRATDSTDSRWGSPPVNRSARPDDPIPKATTLQQREKRFADEEREWQRLSTP